MDSKLNARWWLLTAAAVAFSGAAFYLSKGLTPRWWPIWFAPLAILWIGPRLPGALAAGAALTAGMIGGLSMWGYNAKLQLPLLLQCMAVILPAAAFCSAVLVFRLFIRRGRPALAALVFPSLMTAYEYLFSLIFGTFGVTAYTQLADLPVLQLGVLTGLWGITFAVFAAPAVVAATILSAGKTRLRMAIGWGSVYACLLLFGVWRLSATPVAPHTVTVGMTVSDVPKNLLPQNDADAMRLLREYAQQVPVLAQQGARIVMIPEMTALVRDTISGDVDALFEEAARQSHVQILAAVLHATPNGTFNESRLYSESGGLKAVYRKHHLVPVLEGRTTPADGISVVPDPAGMIGLEICRDMDYSDPARRYGKSDAGLLLVPAWDFDVDRYWHGHMAILRGVENGFTVARAAKQGLLTVSDDRGRILAETRTSANQPFTTMVTTVPVRHDPTLYQVWGDWFAWLDLVLAGALIVIAAAGRRRRSGADALLWQAPGERQPAAHTPAHNL